MERRPVARVSRGLRDCGEHRRGVGVLVSHSNASDRPDASDNSGASDTTLVLMPVLDDWECLARVLERLDLALAGAGRRAQVLLVDDGSTRPAPDGLGPRGAISAVRVLELRCNLGHERAICVGLTFAHRELEPARVVVMDADGEDQPEDVPRLLEELERAGDERVVFAARKRRSESLLFRCFYGLFQALHRLLVGRSIEVGSFSALPQRILDSLVVMPQLWSHYAAAVAVSRIPWSSIPTERGPRIQGRSRLDLVALVAHGFSVLSVYTERIAVRALLASAALSVVSLIVLAALLLGSWASSEPTPWPIGALALLSGVLLVCLVLAAALSLLVLGTRSRSQFLPARDCAVYVRELRSL